MDTDYTREGVRAGRLISAGHKKSSRFALKFLEEYIEGLTGENRARWCTGSVILVILLAVSAGIIFRS